MTYELSTINPPFTAFSHFKEMCDQGLNVESVEEVEGLLDHLVEQGALTTLLMANGHKLYRLNLDA